MKNQNDLICIGVCVLFCLLAPTIMFFGCMRQPVAPPPPTAVITAAPAYPPGTVSFANSLPGGGSAGGMGGGMGGMGGGMVGGMSGGKASFMGGRPGGGGRLGGK